MSIRQVKVVGMSFRQAAASAAYNQGVRSTRLFREPANVHDPNAKKIVLNGHHIGFLPKGFGPIDMGFCELIELRKWTPKRKRADDPQPEPQICAKVRVLSIPDPATGLGLGRAAANMGHVIKSV
jgi:hypothetical protein